MTSNFSTTLGDRPIAAAAIRFLAVVFSTGVHYVVASNLHLFAFPEPLKLRPVGGTVKVVNLTAAEQNRVPNAVKSNPLPIASNPINPSVASQGGNAFPNSAFPPAVSPSPNPAPSPTRSSSNTNPSPTVQPSPNRSANPSISPSTRLGLDPNRTLGSFPPGAPGSPGGSQTPQPTGTSSPGASGSPTTQPPGTTSPQPSPSPPSPTPSKPPSPSPAGDNLAAAQTLFRESLKNQAGSQDVDIERALILKDTAYPAPPRRYQCNSSQDRYVLVGIILGDSSPDGYGEDREEGYAYNTIIAPKGDELSAEATELGMTAAQSAHRARSTAQKLQEKGKRILYKFQFKYNRQTCKS
jgi:hypothetical protein